MTGEMAERQMNLAFVRCCNASVQAVQIGNRGEGVGIHRQDGQGQGGPTLYQTFHGRRQGETTGQQNPRNVRIGVGKAGGQGCQDDIRAISGGDDQMPVLKVIKKIAHLHGCDKVAADQIVKMLLSVQNLCVQPVCHILHAGLPEGGNGGNDKEKRRTSVCKAFNGLFGFFHAVGRDASDEFLAFRVRKGGHIGNDGNRPYGFGLHKVNAGEHGALHFTHRAALRTGDQQHRCTEVGGDIAVQIVFKSGVLAHEVGAFTKNEVIFGFKFFECNENLVHEHIGFAAVDQFQGIFKGTGVCFFIRHVQMKGLHQQLNIMIWPGRIDTVDDGAERRTRPVTRRIMPSAMADLPERASVAVMYKLLAIMHSLFWS